MKTIKFFAVMALAALALIGCGNKDNKSNDRDTVVIIQQVPAEPQAQAEEPVIDDAEIIAAEANIPDEMPKRDIGTLSSFFSEQGRAAAYLVGKINNKYAVHMTLWWHVGRNVYEGEVAYIYSLEGAYYYDSTKNGLKNFLTLYEDAIDRNHVVISEYNAKGDVTGTFDGKVKGNIYEGQFIRAKDGKRMPFKLTYVDCENNGSFVAPETY